MPKRLQERRCRSNSDFRKFDDGLKMTIDVDGESVLKRIEKRLESAEAAGICRYGLHRQNSALMTCIVPSPLHRDHMHFVDGAAGGYAMAATNLKAEGRGLSFAGAMTNCACSADRRARLQSAAGLNQLNE